MSSSSMDQITPRDLAKINSYLDQVEQSIVNFHNAEETRQIIYLIREQIFQQIELQSTLNQKFDIENIIEKNRSENHALITGNDRNQVIFELNIPKFGYSKKKNIGLRENEHLDRKEILDENNEIATSILIPLAILYLILSIIPDFSLQVGLMLIYIPYLFISYSQIELPTSRWMTSNFLISVGMINSIFVLENVVNFEVFPFFFYFGLILPIFSLIISDKILKTNYLISRFSEKSQEVKLGYTLIIGAIIGLLLYSIIFVVTVGFDFNSLPYSAVLFIIFISSLVTYYYFRRYLTSEWDEILLGNEREFENKEPSEIPSEETSQQSTVEKVVDLTKMYHTTNSWTNKLLIPLGLIYILLSSSQDIDFHVLGLIPLMLYVIISSIFTKLPTYRWIVSKSILFIGMVTSISMSFSRLYFTSGFNIIGVISLAILPLISLNITLNLFRTNRIVSEIDKKTLKVQLMYTSVFTFVIYSAIATFLVLLAVGIFDVYSELAFFINPFLIIVFFALSRPFLLKWDTSLLNKNNNSEKILGRKFNQFYEDQQYLENQNSLNLDNTVSNNETESRNVRLSIDLIKANNLTKFRVFNKTRKHLFLIIVIIFSITTYFSYFVDDDILISLIVKFDSEGYYSINDPWEFNDDVILISLLIGGVLTTLLVFLAILERISYSKRKTVKIINHLVLRQGLINIKLLNTIPQNIKAEDYFNELGSLVMKGVLEIEYLGANE